MKPFTYGKWHAREGSSGRILLSDESPRGPASLQARFASFETTDDCINWLFADPADRDAARALHAHIKENQQ